MLRIIPVVIAFLRNICISRIIDVLGVLWNSFDLLDIETNYISVITTVTVTVYYTVVF